MSEQPERSAALKLGIVEQLSREELVKIVLTQQKLIEKLEQELEKLKERQPTNSKTSSKPPSSDLIQKSETAKVDGLKESEKESKRQPGGQPGHIGKTRKGFGRVDRYQISTPESCEHCGSRELSDAIGYSKQQVACLAALPIEVVEYQARQMSMPRMWSNGSRSTSIRDRSRTRLEHRPTSIIGMAR